MEETPVKKFCLWGEIARETTDEQNTTAAQELIGFLRSTQSFEPELSQGTEGNRRVTHQKSDKIDSQHISLRRLYDPRVIDSVMMANKINLPNDKEEIATERPILIAESQENEVLRRGVALLAAHQGFHHADADALQTLTDVSKDLMRRISQLLSVQLQTSNKEDHIMKSLQKALQQVGIPDLESLDEYYRSHVVVKHERLKGAGMGSPKRKPPHQQTP